MPIPAIGEAAQRFRAWTTDGQPVTSDDLAGRFTTLCFFGSAGVPQMHAMVRALAASTDVFDGVDHQFVGVTIDPDDIEPDRGLDGVSPRYGHRGAVRVLEGRAGRGHVEDARDGAEQPHRFAVRPNAHFFDISRPAQKSFAWR